MGDELNQNLNIQFSPLTVSSSPVYTRYGRDIPDANKATSLGKTLVAMAKTLLKDEG